MALLPSCLKRKIKEKIAGVGMRIIEKAKVETPWLFLNEWIAELSRIENFVFVNCLTT